VLKENMLNGISGDTHLMVKQVDAYGASPGFPVEFGGVSQVHAAFLAESRKRGHW
jgi:hypothetical protein